MYKPRDQTVTITVTGRPDFMINVYSKATETPLKADSPRLGTITSSLGDAGKHWIWLQKTKENNAGACRLMPDCYHY